MEYEVLTCWEQSRGTVPLDTICRNDSQKTQTKGGNDSIEKKSIEFQTEEIGWFVPK